MSPEPESLILQLLRDMRADIGDVRSEIDGMRKETANKGDIADLRSEMTSLRADVASDIHVARKEIGEQIVGLRPQSSSIIPASSVMA